MTEEEYFLKILYDKKFRYQELYREKNIERTKKFKREHPDYAKQWLQTEKGQISRRKIENKYRINRIKNDSSFKILTYLRNRINIALKRNTKSGNIIDLLGCNIDFLKKHLESQFVVGMSWENYGKWHIDHIRPCAGFNLSIPEEQRKCFHYSNLQPLWARDNILKSNH